LRADRRAGTDIGRMREWARRRPSGSPPGPRRGRPNVLYIVWDDANIATWNAFGGLVLTPNLKWLAGRGLRFTQWHTPAQPGLTRSSLLGGPGAGTLAETLSGSGYRTYCVGQWQSAGVPGSRPAGAGMAPEDWPLACGFDHFYGFLGRTNQWCPDLIYDNQSVDPPYGPAEGYHLSRDLAETAVEFIRDGLRAAPGQPWLCYLSFGASSVPHVAPQEWAEAYRGRFEMGYDRYHEIALASMKRLGVVPEGTRLAPAGDPGPSPGDGLVRPWHALSSEHKRLGQRLAESAAGLCSFTDQQLGRVLDYLKDSGQLDGTLVVACSANATQAAAPPGPLLESVGPADWPGPARTLGGPGGPGDLAGCGHLLAGWARAFGTPYSMPRQSLVGGTAPAPLIISWPRLIRGAAGGVRDQYHYAADLVPTILDCAASIPPAPGAIRDPAPTAGVSMRYTFTSPDAPSARPTQLYQAPGAGAIYHEGWKAIAPHDVCDRWQLYDVAADRTETADVAAQYPARTAALAVQWRAATTRSHLRPRFAPESHPMPAPPPTPVPARPAGPVAATQPGLARQHLS
jgi:arylsulfatase